MHLALFIARRFFREKNATSRATGVATRIATVGVALGIAVMVVSLCILHGYKDTIRAKVTGFGGHIVVQDENASVQAQAYPLLSSTALPILERMPEVAHAEPYVICQGVLKTETDFLGLAFKGVDECFSSDFLRAHLVEGAMPRFSPTDARDDIVVSRATASALGLKVGSRVFTYFFDGSMRVRRFRVAGIYQTNLSAFDGEMALANMYTCQKLQSWKGDMCSGISVTLHHEKDLLPAQRHIISSLRENHSGQNYSVMNIREIYSGLFNWLQLLDMDVWIIFVLMFLVAGFTIVSGLLILILERIRTIGVFKTLGAGNGLVGRVFVCYTTFILLRSMILGNILGFTLIGLQHFFHLVRLDPTKYYVDSVPVAIHPEALLALNGAVFALSVALLFLPALLVRRVDPSRIVRFE